MFPILFFAVVGVSAYISSGVVVAIATGHYKL